MDGIVLAKSFKQAIGILSKTVGVPKSKIRLDIKKGKDNDLRFFSIKLFKAFYFDWSVDIYPTRKKGKSRIIGWR